MTVALALLCYQQSGRAPQPGGKGGRRRPGYGGTFHGAAAGSRICLSSGPCSQCSLALLLSLSLSLLLSLSLRALSLFSLARADISHSSGPESSSIH